MSDRVGRRAPAPGPLVVSEVVSSGPEGIPVDGFLSIASCQKLDMFTMPSG
jgi:hypothetical protein